MLPAPEVPKESLSDLKQAGEKAAAESRQPELKKGKGLKH
jgi:hypothetical protein